MFTVRHIIAFMLLAFFASTAPALADGTFRVAMFQDGAPYSFMQKGTMRGILVDVLDEALGKRMGILVEYKGYPWARAQLQVENGAAHAFVTNPTPARKQYTVTGTEALVTPEQRVFTYAGHSLLSQMEQITSFEDMKDLRVGVILGNGIWKKKVVDKGIVLPRFQVSDINNLISMLADKRFDIMFENADIAHYNIKKMNLAKKVVEVPGVVLGTGNFVLCIGKDSPYRSILPQFDAIIREMRNDGTLERIYQRYR